MFTKLYSKGVSRTAAALFLLLAVFGWYVGWQIDRQSMLGEVSARYTQLQAEYIKFDIERQLLASQEENYGPRNTWTLEQEKSWMRHVAIVDQMAEYFRQSCFEYTKYRRTETLQIPDAEYPDSCAGFK